MSLLDNNETYFALSSSSLYLYQRYKNAFININMPQKMLITKLVKVDGLNTLEDGSRHLFMVNGDIYKFEVKFMLRY